MKQLFIFACIVAAPFTMQAQFGDLLRKAKDKVTQRADNKVDKAMDKKLDELEGKSTPTSSAETKAKSESSDAPTVVKSYSKFDFVPGAKVLYAEDFSQDEIGELPLTWNASGKGEVQTMSAKEGKWLRLFGNTSYLSGNTKQFGENYTIEFDMMYYFQPKTSGYLLPDLQFGFFSTGQKETTDNSFLRSQGGLNSVEVEIHPNSSTTAILKSRSKGNNSFSSDRVAIEGYMDQFNKLQHYAIQVQKTRFRMWINETKVFDIPRAVLVGDTMNQLVFKLEGSNYKDAEVGLFLSNLKVATGLPDTRHKLLDEGKFSTTGILFDVSAATIKPESAGVLKEIASVLKENEAVKIKIIGHTDSDGADAANLELSKKRAEAVKAALVKDYSINAERISTDGKGEAVPVADNKTKEGKAQNRRVEFIKS